MSLWLIVFFILELVFREKCWVLPLLEKFEKVHYNLTHSFAMTLLSHSWLLCLSKVTRITSYKVDSLTVTLICLNGILVSTLEPAIAPFDQLMFQLLLQLKLLMYVNWQHWMVGTLSVLTENSGLNSPDHYVRDQPFHQACFSHWFQSSLTPWKHE